MMVGTNDIVAMDPHQSRHEILHRRLDQLQLSAAAICAVDAGVGSRVRPELEKRLSDANDLLNRLNGTASTPESWRDLASVDASLRKTSGLVLTWLAAAEARRSGLDGGSCTVAERIIDGVKRRGGPAWDGAAVPAEAESVDHQDLLIRVQFPDDGVWSLPMILHELGHVMGSGIWQERHLDVVRTERVYPLQRALASAGAEEPREWYHRRELFADVYATYVGGPSFLASCVALRFAPSVAKADTATHPSPMRRVAVMLEVLGRMETARESEEARLVSVAADLRQLWVNQIDQSPDDLGVAEIDRGFVEECWSLLHEELPQIRYRTLRVALRVAYDLAHGTAESADIREGTDVLNGAWLARLSGGPVTAERISLRALDMLKTA